MALEEDVILHFDIDEQPAVNSIKDLRAANKQLREERDKVNISTKTGQDAVQKLNAQIDKNNKLIKDNSSALEKQRQNVGNYSKSIQEAAGELNIMGTNVGALTTKLASFVNPATAVVGVITALSAAYASSAKGANDLANAQNNLRAGLDTFLNRIGNATDGNIFGNLSKRINIAIANLTNLTREEAEAEKQRIRIAEIELKTLRDLELDRIEASGRQKQREKEAEKYRIIRDNQENTITERLKASENVAKSIQGIETETVGILQRQINALISYGENTGAIVDGNIIDRDLNIQILNLKNEISDKQEFVTGKLTENVTAQRNLNAELVKQNKELEKGIKDLNEIKRFKPGGDTGDLSFNDDVTSSPESNPIFDSVVEFRTAEEIKRDEAQTTALQINAYNEQVAKNEQELNELRLESAQVYFAGVATLAAAFQGEQSALFKIAATAEAIIATYQGANKALGSAPPPLSFALAAATVATGLANVARINGVGFAEGGYTGRGAKYQPAGIVHKGEYVAPQNVVNSPSAQPHLAALESMRTKGFADGGFVANQNQQQVRQAMMFANALKNMPPVIASWTEGRAVGRKLEFKEKVARQ